MIKKESVRLIYQMKKLKKTDADKLLIKKKKLKKLSYGDYITRDAVNRIFKKAAKAHNEKTKDNDGV